METKNKEFTGIDIPETITDPEEREYFEQIEKVISIAAKKQLPILCLSAYNDLSRSFISAQGCKHCLTKMIKGMLDKEPGMFDVIMGGIALHMAEKCSADIKMVEYARKNTPTGN